MTCPTGTSKSFRSPRNRRIAVRCRHVSRRKRAPDRTDLGCRRPSAELGAHTKPRRAGPIPRSVPAGTDLCLAGACSRAGAGDRHGLCRLRDEQGFHRECEDAARDGFVGKMAIHPAQVPIINAVFTPSTEAIGRAQAIIDAFVKSPGVGVVGIGGVMYDRPHLARAERLLARVAIDQRIDLLTAFARAPRPRVLQPELVDAADRTPLRLAGCFSYVNHPHTRIDTRSTAKRYCRLSKRARATKMGAGVYGKRRKLGRYRPR